MFSKAINIYLKSCQASRKLPLTKLPQTQIKSLTGGHFPVRHFTNTPRWFFTTIKEDVKKSVPEQESTSEQTFAQATQTTQTATAPESDAGKQSKTHEVEEIKEDFVEYMLRDPSKTEMIYDYYKKAIFVAEPPTENYKSTTKLYWGIGAFWSATCYLTYNYLNPWFTVIPGIFLFGSYLSISMTRLFAKKMVQKIELVDPYHIKLYPMVLNGGDVLCSVEDTEILGVHILGGSEDKDKDKNVPANKSYLILANFKDTLNKRTYSKMRLIVDPKVTMIENVDLLKCILYARPAEISKFKFYREADDLNAESTETNQEEKKENEEEEEDEFAEYKIKIEDKPEDKRK